MKNILLLIFFSITSLLSLVVLIILAILPKLCCCFTSFCNKNYKTIKKQNTRARRIKRARLRVLYKSQITKEKPIQIELDRSKGLFFDEEADQKVRDEESLANFYTGQYNASFLTWAISGISSTIKQEISSVISALSKIALQQKLDSFFSNLGNHNKSYFGQIRSYVASSVTKYLNH